jgi:hypothetical protein
MASPRRVLPKRGIVNLLALAALVALALGTGLQARAAATQIDVSPLSIVNGKASGSISGFQAGATVAIEGQTFAADPGGVVTLSATPLNGDSALTIQFTDAQGTLRSVNAELRDSQTGQLLDAAGIADPILNTTQPVMLSTGDGDANPVTGSSTGTESGGGTAGGSDSGKDGGRQPAGAVKLAGAGTSIPASSVTSGHLVIAKVQFSPSTIRSRKAITARVVVKDARGFLVRDALVFVRGVPARRLLPAAEKRTAMNGSVAFTLRPTKLLPLTKGARLTLFVRARKAGEPVVGGAAGRRLVSMRLSSPSR